MSSQTRFPSNSAHLPGSNADFLNSTYLAQPGYLASANYQSPKDPKDTAVQKACSAEGKDLIGILTERPELASGFGTLMSMWGEGNSLIQDLYPVNERLAIEFDLVTSSCGLMWPEGMGRRPSLSSMLVLISRFVFGVQDLLSVIENAPKSERIETTGHDFFTEQPTQDRLSLLHQ
ncbi:hypothetical protein ABVK25_003482 [Lepraria finkii]|uniref:Uncharacterized protein n=1 Tax=Lepraria finkii TaxID=1340010 RepID=A0ABR4BF23_9LECA